MEDDITLELHEWTATYHCTSACWVMLRQICWWDWR